MWSRFKSNLDKYIPTHVGNPFGLARRMVSSGNRAALFTLSSTILGILCIPLDLLLSRWEKRLIQSATPTPANPVIFVCGPARSGTTLVYQVLSRYLDVSCLQNITVLFPRSPITATKIYRRLGGHKRDIRDDFENYYGKTSGMYGPSEANHIWNRWVRPDSTGFRTIVSETAAKETARFFSAFEEVDNKAVLAKNNNLNVFADRIADAIPNFLIICLRRNPAYLAQSLLQARREIRGNIADGYGVQNVEDAKAESDPIKAVCVQISYLNRKAEEFQSIIGPERFWIVDYEQFCKNPGDLVTRVVNRFEIGTCNYSRNSSMRSIPMRNIVRDPSEMRRIVEQLDAIP